MHTMDGPANLEGKNIEHSQKLSAPEKARLAMEKAMAASKLIKEEPTPMEHGFGVSNRRNIIDNPDLPESFPQQLDLPLEKNLDSKNNSDPFLGMEKLTVVEFQDRLIGLVGESEFYNLMQKHDRARIPVINEARTIFAARDQRK
jgi:hypothetical protein